MTTKSRSANIVRIKSKFQITIPVSVQRQLNLSVGDLLEASAEQGTIVLTPKAIINKPDSKSQSDLFQIKNHQYHTNKI